MKEFLDDSFKDVAFWVHVGGFSIECFTKEVGRKVAGRLRGCGEIEIRERAEDDGRPFFRIWCMVDVHKPFRHRIKLITPVHSCICGVIRYRSLFAFIVAVLATH